MDSPGSLDVEHAVRERYSDASRQRVADLCCPIEYDAQYLAVLPDELIERDYGCGNPAAFVREGETVLDLGSGGGKICYIASQIVGPRGRVIGVDMNDDMLDLARRYRQTIGAAIGWHNVTFHKGRIQDLALDLERFEQYLAEAPPATANAWLQAQGAARRLAEAAPMIADGSVDVVLSNCVLNLVRPEDRRQLFAEIHRVLRPGGRAVISDIVSDEAVPERLRSDPQLWSGCISGAFLEQELLAEFAAAGMYGMTVVDRQVEPWAVVEGIEFRSLTVVAYRNDPGPCIDHRQAVIYRGPWKTVQDDDGHSYERGARMAVCEKTFRMLCQPPYAAEIIPVPPQQAVAAGDGLPFDCSQDRVRHPRETKNAADPAATVLPVAGCCSADEGC